MLLRPAMEARARNMRANPTRSPSGLNAQRGAIGPQTVNDPQRLAYPGIYKRPDVVAREAFENSADEDPSLHRLFGVHRSDLHDMNVGRVGNQEPGIAVTANPKNNSKAALNVMTDANRQRVTDALGEAEKYPRLFMGMDSWYEMQPVFDRLAQITGDPVGHFNDFQTFTGMSSPGSEVLTELNRGTAARYLNKQNRFDEFLKHGGKGSNAPKGFIDYVRGHPYHSTSQAGPMQKYITTGAIQSKEPKVPLYVQSAGVPQTGFQTKLPVPDAHFMRSLGFGDTRTAKNYGKSASTPELLTLEPFWTGIADDVGLNAVNAQGRQWGLFAPQTGVTSPIGAPKLELLSMKIMDTARIFNISPETARDLVLLGETYTPTTLKGL